MKKELVTVNDVENRMKTIRGLQVLLDCDVAELYGVETKRVNEAVMRNPEKFPDGYVLELDNQESAFLRSQSATLDSGRGHYTKNNYKAYTERGLYMLATILKSKTAVQTTIAIIETFTRIREMARTMETLQNITDGSEQQKTLLKHTGEILADVIGKNLRTTTSETEITLNFAVVSIKHKITRTDKEE